MIRINGSDEYINQTQVDAIQPLLGEFWNSSLSWTTSEGSWTRLAFTGSHIWAYGLAGPDQGSFTAAIDNTTVGFFCAQQDNVDYHHLIFDTEVTGEGVHYLTLTNSGNQSLAFDYAVVLSKTETTTSSSAEPSSVTSIETSSILLPSTASDMTSTASTPSPQYESQLAEQTGSYPFKWTGAMYFVAIFSSLLGVIFLIWLSYALYRWWQARRSHKSTAEEVVMSSQDKQDSATEQSDGGSSWLIMREKERVKVKRSTKLLEALRSKKISPPRAEDNGGITTGGRRGSSGTASSSGTRWVQRDVEKGWQ
ncbi:hypothetical protein I350_02344 [Cryptococcus amylolentus CBS 6273]|uniref:Uncharacterized protein n=2 Tax=Cryptococcus amylolentus TaxID=104669 RepID=A0A1E3KAU7_9TREE|nr:hypothetical protein I350_02344 [Cryptococcus amylolentus CBS 6273]